MYIQTGRGRFNRLVHCHFKPLFLDHLSGFRKGHSCQSVLTNFVETCTEKTVNCKTVNFVSVQFSQTCRRLSTASRVVCLSVTYLAVWCTPGLMPAISNLL